MREVSLTGTRMEESNVVRRGQINEQLMGDFETIAKLTVLTRRRSLSLGGKQRLLKPTSSS